MIAALLRLFALRPLFSLMIFGFPLLLLVAVGLFAIVALKFVVFFVLPVALAIWVLRKLFRSGSSGTSV
jgi:hypothetical protein